MNKSKKVKFTDAIVEVLKIYSKIGKRSTYESFVVVYDNKMKVVHDSGAVLSVFYYDSIGLEKPFALFDANKLLQIINVLNKSKEPYEFVFKNDSSLIIKSKRSSKTLFLVDFIEKNDSNIEEDVDENDRIIGHVIIGDDKLKQLEEATEETKQAEFTLTKADINQIKIDQRIMNVSNKFSIMRDEENIKIVVTDESVVDQSDSSDYKIVTGIDLNDLNEKDMIKICVPLDYLLDDDYKVTIGENIVLLNGINKDITYIIAPEVVIEEETLKNDFEDDFSNDFE